MQAYSYNDRQHLRMVTQSAATVRRPRTWLVSSTIDILFVCGLAPWLLGFVAYMTLGGIPSAPLVSEPQQQMTILFVVASLIIGEGHQFTSIIRYYTKKRPRQKGQFLLHLPFWSIYAGFASIFLLMFGFAFMEMPVILILSIGVNLAIFLFPVVLLQHFCAQAKAIGLIYCGKEGFELSPWEKRTLTVATYFLVLAGAVTIAQPFGLTPATIPPNFFKDAQALLVPAAMTASGTFALMMLNRGLTTERWLPFGAGMLWTNLVVFVLLPFPAMLYVWLFVPLFFHATQHWAIAWMVHQKEAQIPPTAPLKKQVLEFCKLALPIQALSLSVLFLPLFGMQLFNPTKLQPGVLDITATLPVSWSMLVFYLHYFADRVVWRPK